MRETRDFNQVKCIKDEREHLLVKEDVRSDIDGKSILINYSMVRIRTQPLSWMTLLMTPIGALCEESKNLRSERR